MRNFKTTMRLMLSVMLIAAMLLSLVSCAVPPVENRANQEDEKIVLDSTSRQEQETIVSVLGKGDYTETEISGMSDSKLKELAQKLLDQLAQEKENAENSGFYDESGAMTLPFDQAYPELVENGTVVYDDETLLIKMSNSQNGQITEAMKTAGVAAMDAIVPMEKATWYEAKLVDGTDATKAIEQLRELKEVLLVEYNFQLQTSQIDHYAPVDSSFGLENNTAYAQQWYMNHCGIADGYKAMTYPGGSSSVVVAVIDTGVDIDHEDLINNIWANPNETPDNGIDDDGNGYVDDYYGVNIVAGYGNGDDDNGHGTHVAGIIAAENNAIGTVGIAYNVKIMPVKAAMASGALNQSDIAKAVLYAFEMGAEVINMSFGGTACSMAVQDALAVAYTRCVLVASAGNDGAHNEYYDCALPNFPAALTYVVGVMSVDQNGVESNFSNWDVIAYSKVEYEVYAPGENIMSTLPNDRYGALSGTSMAAPVVAAMAAILRSEFADRDKYPTKFIYGQLCCTSEHNATCINPDCHGDHNLPQIVDLHGALTKSPVPQVNMQEYYTFDSVELAEGNNGDGVIDAGETIALGLILRNRWGMSKDTIVTIDAESFAGIADPYITIVNPEINYGYVGTYSTQDAGAIYDGELLVGWEHPFYLKIADNCPNDYIFALNVNIRCNSALDEENTNTYISRTQQIMLTVRNGVILPGIINEDMVLTADNLYIIPSSTMIEEGATVRVEPGTHIQFWSNDPTDPYGDSYIAYLKVKGTLLVEGTAENPVYIYPSDLMGMYAVDIGSSGNGYVSLQHADITNYQNRMSGGRIDYADHCTFRQNYQVVYYRYVDKGEVRDNYYDINAHWNAKKITNSVFYKVRGYLFSDLCDTCIFVQSGLDFYGCYSNNVFLGNRYENQTDEWGLTDVTSSITVHPIALPNASSYSVYYNEMTGTTYLRMEITTSEAWFAPAMIRYMQDAFGGQPLVINDVQELAWLRDRINWYRVLVTRDPATGDMVWHDGTPVADFLLPVKVEESSDWIRVQDGKLSYGWSSGFVFEIPGQIMPESIHFREYLVNMDENAFYQIAPQSAPVQLSNDSFLYESSDESVLTVSSTGLVTPVGNGTADVYVYSKDRAVYNYITFEIVDYVALEGLAFPASSMRLAVGKTASVSCQLTPANTTRRHVTYTSSDEEVVKVDEAGNITAIAKGIAQITATCEGYTATMLVETYRQADALSLDKSVVSVKLSEGTVALPRVLEEENADVDLVWSVTDENVTKIENGKLVLRALGTSNIQVTDRNSGLTASCLVIVGDEDLPAVKKIEARWDTHQILFEDGRLYQWGPNQGLWLVTENVVDFAADRDYTLILRENGMLERWYSWLGNAHKQQEFDWFVGQNIAGIEITQNGGDYYFVYTAEGNAYAWGSASEYGNLGLGTNNAVEQPKLIQLEDVVDIVTHYNFVTYFLTGSGDLYYAGGEAKKTQPTLCATGIAQIYNNAAETGWINVLTKDGKWACITNDANGHGNVNTYYVDLSEMDQVSISNSDYGIGLRDGQVYVFRLNDEKPVPLAGVTNAKLIYTVQDVHYIVNQDNVLLMVGRGASTSHAPDGIGYQRDTLIPVLFEDYSWENVSYFGSNVDASGILTDRDLTVYFTKNIASCYAELYAGNEQYVVGIRCDGTNGITFYRTTGFTPGLEYTLVIREETVQGTLGATNSQEIRITFTYQPEEQTDSETGGVVTPAVTHKSVKDNSVQRILTPDVVVKKVEEAVAKSQYNPQFAGNVLLNPVSTDTTVGHWLRPLAGGEDGNKVSLGGNYWGTTNETTIGLQMLDYMDFANYGHFLYTPYLMQAPENTFPFVTGITILNAAGESVTTVGNETITVRIFFNRDMDTSIDLLVKFGSYYPYGDYEITGHYVDARTWEGTYTLNTVIENGIQYWSISNGCSATGNLQLQLDEARFCFKIDTSAAQALIMQGIATDSGVQLTWQQDDFDTLMGYNVYRSTSEDGYYQRLNSTVIPADQMNFFDDTVEPGVVYYYNFTVVKTDLSESEPSGKITIMSMDTMQPDIYHSPIKDAYINTNLVIYASITDNLHIVSAKLYFRTIGQEQWQVVNMSAINDRYSALITAQHVTADGLEYYIEAFDGVTYTYKGTAENPYVVETRVPVTAEQMGDVDGDGQITNLDALLLLYAINDKYNMNAGEFERADLNGDGVLTTAEALMILRYVSGEIDSLQMP